MNSSSHRARKRALPVAGLCISALLFYLAFASPVHARILASDDFDEYAADAALASLNKGIGWDANGWNAKAGASISTETITYMLENGVVLGGGNALKAEAEGDHLFLRKLSSPVTEGCDVFVSFIFKIGSTAAGDDDGAELPAGNIFASWQALDGEASNNIDTIGLIGANAQVGARVNNSTTSIDTKLKFGQVYLFVIKYIWDDDAAAYRGCKVWLNPSLNDEASTNPTVAATHTGTAGGSASFDGLRVRTFGVKNGRYHIVDALRVGTTWTDVVGIPTGVVALPADTTKLVAFGDSLSSGGPGNNPATGPGSTAEYPRLTWVTQISSMAGYGELGNHQVDGVGSNYAKGGHTTVDLIARVDDFLNDYSDAADPRHLYVLWCGGNDVGHALRDNATAVVLGNKTAVINAATAAAERMEQQIRRLAGKGAKTFYWIDLPDLSKTPAVDTYATGVLALLRPTVASTLNEASAAFNNRMAAALASLRNDLPGITIHAFSAWDFFNTIIANPGTYGFTNVTSSCEADGVTTIAAGANNYLFWDGVHPTAHGHNLIAKTVLADWQANGLIATPPAPVVSGVFAPSAAPVAGDVISITGVNFGGLTQVLLGDVQAAVIGSTGTVIHATFPPGATVGPVTVVTSPASVNQTTWNGAWTTTPLPPAPSISAFSETTAAPGDAITITGQNLTSITGVSVGGIAAVIVSDPAPTGETMTFIIPGEAVDGTIKLDTAAGPLLAVQRLTISSAPPPPTPGGGYDNAGLIAVDDFDLYTTGTINGQNGGSGWEGAWKAAKPSSGSAISIVDDAITYQLDDGRIIGGGKSLKIQGVHNNILARAIPAAKQVTNGDDVYLSFIFQVKKGSSTGTFTDNIFSSWAAVMDTSATTFDDGTYGIVGAAGNVAARVKGSSSVTASLDNPLKLGQVYFFVIKYTGWENGHYTKCQAWLNPGIADASATPETQPGMTVIATNPGNGSTGFGGIGLRTVGLTSNNFQLIDNIRIGTSWASVVGVVATDTAPVIESITPLAAHPGDSITITGKNLSGATVTIGNEPATIVSSGDTSLVVIVPDGIFGDSVAVTITTGAGTLTAAQTLTVAPPLPLGPAITGITPLSVQAGGTITIAGTNLTGATAVTIGGIAAIYTVDSATQITATVPALEASSGISVTVTTGEGTATAAQTLTVTTPSQTSPTITGIDHSTAYPGQTITITGANLSGATVTIGGIQAVTGVNTETQITVAVPAIDPGAEILVVVTTDEGEISTTITITNAPASRLLATDDFDRINGGSGWAAGGWTFKAGSEIVTGESIAYFLEGVGTLGGGNTLKIATSGDSPRAITRAIESSVADGNDIFVRFIFQVKNTDEDDGAVFDSGQIFTAWSADTGSYTKDAAGVIGTGGRVAARVAGGSSSGQAFVNGNLIYGQTYLFVIRYTGWDGTAYRTCQIWLNPKITDEATTDLDITAIKDDSANGSTRFDGLAVRAYGLGGSKYHLIDALCIGRTWLDVMSGATLPPPPPPDPDNFTVAEQSEGWVPLQHSLNIAADGVFDFSQEGILDAPAGKHGAIKATSSGHFEFENKPGARVRFWGVNLAYDANYITNEQADDLADRFARSGYNTVRIHHFDRDLVIPPATLDAPVTLDSDRLAKLDYLFAAFKARGIYVNIDLYSDRNFSAAELAAFGTGNKADFKGLVPINEAALASWKKFASALLTHVNPHTGIAWGQDPALIGICPVNEDPLWRHYDNSGRLLPLYRAKFVERHPQYAGTNWNSADNTRDTLWRKFIYTINAESDATLRAYLKDTLQVKALITGANYTIAQGLAFVRQHYDYVDNHQYSAHPSGGWALPLTFSQGSELATRAFLPGRMMPTRIFGKPFVSTEFHYCRPNRNRFEGMLLMPAYASLQDWDALYNFHYAHNASTVTAGSADNYFAVANDPINLIGDRVGALLFQRGDIAPATRAITYAVTEAEAFNDAVGKEFEGNFRTVGLVARIGSLVGDPAAILAANPSLNAAVVGSGATPAGTYQSNSAILTTLQSAGVIPSDSVQGNVTRSDTGEIEINNTARTLRVVTPRGEHFVVSPGAAITGARVAITNGSIPASVSVLALKTAGDTNAPSLATARRILVTHLTDSLTTGMTFAGIDRTVLTKWGQLPHLVRNGSATLTLTLPEGNWIAYKVDITGARIGEHTAFTPVSGQPGIWQMDISTGGTPETGAQFAYELVYVVPSAPVVATFSPISAHPGDTITITGENLEGASVTIGGVAAAILTNTAETITVAVPNGALGSALSIVVTTSGGSATATQTLAVTTMVPAPVITAVSPVEAQFGDTITITGSNLGGASVTIGGVTAEILNVDGGQITVTVPGVSGSGLAVVVTTAGGTATALQTITVTEPGPSAPEVTGISPVEAHPGDTITITGINLSGASVTIGGTSVALLSNTDTIITFAIPNGLAGSALGIVVTTAGGSASVPQTISVTTPVPVPAPVISNILPLYAHPGDTITITGSNLGDASVTIGGVPVQILSNSGDTITIKVPEGITGGAISITTAGGTATSVRQAIITPDSGNSGALSAPAGMVVSPGSSSERLYVSDAALHTIQYVASGSLLPIAGKTGVSGLIDGVGVEARFKQPRGLSINHAGVLIVADAGNDSLRAVTADGVVTTTGTVGPDTVLAAPAGVAAYDGAGGETYIADTDNHLIKKIAADGLVSVVAGSATSGTDNGPLLSACFNAPAGVAVDVTGKYLYVADTGNHVIRLIDLTGGSVSTFAGQMAFSGDADGAALSAALFDSPAGIIVDGAGDVYVADTGNSRIRLIASGTVSTIAGGAPGFLDGTGVGARFRNPLALALAGDGGIYVADTGNGAIRLIANDASSTVSTLALATGASSPGPDSTPSKGGGGGGAHSLWFLLAFGVLALARRFMKQ